MRAAERRLRVLTLVDGPGLIGGGERIARQISLNLDPERFEVVFCVTRGGPGVELEAEVEELHEAGVAFATVDRRGRFDVLPWRRLVGRARAWQVDVVHSHKVGSNAWGALLTPLMGNPVFVAHEQTWAYDDDPLRVLLDRELIGRRADAFIAVSREDQRRMIEVERISPEKTRLIPNGIPSFPEPTPGSDPRAELGIAPDAPLVGVVATLRPQKALDVLIRALPELRRRVPEVRVVLAGGGTSGDSSEEKRLRAVAAEVEAGDALQFLGARTDIPDLVAAFDLGALSSDYEGTPLSVMEYMEAGKAVVATAVGGVPELVVDGETGLLVPPQDPEALADALAELLLDPDRRRRMGAAGRRRRREMFSIEATAGRVADLYEELARR